MSHACLRICCRALLLIILCTARGVYAKLEQPASSVMNYMPDFDSTGALISDHLGMWREVFLPSPQTLQQPNLLSELDGQLGSQNPKAQSSLGDRAGVSVSRPRKCLFHLPRLWLEELYRKFGHAEREELLQEAKAQGLQVTVKYKKANGEWGVSGPEHPHLFSELETCQPVDLHAVEARWKGSESYASLSPGLRQPRDRASPSPDGRVFFLS